MKYPNKKPVKKALWGSAIMGGIGLATSIIGSNQAKKAEEEAQMAAQRANFRQSIIEQDVYSDEFQRKNVNDLPVYAKGGKMTNTNKLSTTGELSPTGGNLIPISDNAEVVDGNTHEENTIDNSYGVTLAKDGEPVANVEDKEVVVNNDLVFSDKLMKNGKSFADIALDINSKIGDLQAEVKTTVRPEKRFALERTIKGLEKKNQDLFKEQEITKLQEVGPEEETVDVIDGSVPVGANGLSINSPYKKKSILDSYREQQLAKEQSKSTDPASIVNDIPERDTNIIKDVAPLVADNVANFILAKNAPKPPRPLVKRAPILDTRVNVNPQLAEVESSVQAGNTAILNNTNNSAVARANITANNIKKAQLKSNIYAQKQGQERALQNQQKQVLADTANVNAGLTDDYNADVRESSLQRNSAYSENVTNLVEDVQAVKQNELQKESDDTLITMSLLDDPTGEKARYYSRVGKNMTKENKALLLKELQRIQNYNKNKVIN